MLSLHNIQKSYRSGDMIVPALRGVSIDFRENEFVSILGQSGCGKTTLLNVIGGLDRYDGGDLKINGRSTKEFRDADWDTYRNHSIGFVFQSYNLIGHQTVLANVELALTLSGVSREERRARAIAALEQVGLGDQLHKKPSQMSGGQMQRVAIARALVNDPDILLADEPTGALDTATSVQIMEILKEVSKTKLIIMVTHNPELAETYSTRIIRLRDGQVVGDTNPYTIPEEAQTPAAPLTEQKTAEPTDTAQARPKVKKGKRSMSLLTALSLSLTNLMTKKTRTLLVSVAGSIGIIGIALILALSNGVNLYIANVQEETLTSYPVSLTAESANLASMMSAMVTVHNTADREKEPRTVYVDDSISNFIKAMTNVERNNLAGFDAWLEEHWDEIKNDVTAVQRSYDMKLQIYNNTPDYGLVQVSPSDIMTNFSNEYSGLEMYTSSLSIFSELMPGRDGELINPTVYEQYDLVEGKWPSAANELVLVVDRNSTLTNLTLYMLGLCDPAEMSAMLVAMMTGESYDANTSNISFSYDEFFDLKLNLAYNSDFYRIKDAAGYEVDGKTYPIWEDKRDDENFDPATLFSDGMELSIVGIICPNADANSTSIQGSVAYTKALTDTVLGKINESDLVKQQLETPAYDVFTGLPFIIDDADTLSDAEKAEKLQQYFGRLTDEERANVYTRIQTTMTDEEIAEKLEQVRTNISTPAEKRLFMINMYGFANGQGDLVGDTAIRRQLLTILSTLGVSEELFTQYAGAFGLDGVALEPGKEPYTTYENLINALYSDDRKLDRAFDNMVKTTLTSVNAMVKAADIQKQIAADYVAGVMRDCGLAEGSAMPNIAAVRAYIVAYYQSQTTLPQSVIEEYVNSLSMMPTDPTNPQSSPLMAEFGTALAATSAAMLADEDYVTSATAAMLDSYFADREDDAARTAAYAALYEDYMEKSGSTLEENLKEVGASRGRDALTSIQIYPVDFEAKERIVAHIAEYNSGVAEEDKIQYTDIVSLIMSSVTIIINAISYVLIAFVSISLVVSSIMIGIITYISVLERTKEIGILRAIGASKRDISRVFNAETLIIGFAAGVIGILATVLFCLPINLIIHHLSGIRNINAALPVAAGFILVAISMALTLIAGLIPSRIASKKDPVEALRTE